MGKDQAPVIERNVTNAVNFLKILYESFSLQISRFYCENKRS